MVKYHKKRDILKIQSEIRRKLADVLRSKDFIEISPVIISPITDPLNHPTMPANIMCYGKRYHITQSMTLHKQLALKTLDKIFVFSPNVRLEEVYKKKTARHLFEFTQLDLEIKDASREDVMKLCEELLTSVIRSVNKNCKKELKNLKRKIKMPKSPFKKIRFEDAFNLYGENFEEVLSKKINNPVWIIDIPITKREFYDKEDPNNPGYLIDMDLIYPEGYGEALSGGEREYEIEKIKKRILLKNQQVSQFDLYIKNAKDKLPPSAGFGIGIERLTRYICGLERIEETSLFPKIPGKLSL